MRDQYRQVVLKVDEDRSIDVVERREVDRIGGSEVLSYQVSGNIAGPVERTRSHLESEERRNSSVVVVVLVSEGKNESQTVPARRIGQFKQKRGDKGKWGRKRRDRRSTYDLAAHIAQSIGANASSLTTPRRGWTDRGVPTEIPRVVERMVATNRRQRTSVGTA
jgi:hypothetical protein